MLVSLFVRSKLANLTVSSEVPLYFAKISKTVSVFAPLYISLLFDTSKSGFGAAVGLTAGLAVGDALGSDVGVAAGVAVGLVVGAVAGVAVGLTAGLGVGGTVGLAAGLAVGVAVGAVVGAAVTNVLFAFINGSFPFSSISILFHASSVPR